jgi:cytochrome c oxidase cbb3-type subunit 2
MRLEWKIVRAVALGLLLAAAAAAQEEGLIHRGREVYLAEGCIHCHSQYVRPGSDDERRWGPAHPLAEATRELPPLLGARRQGPDLQNVGARRNPEWLRLQLQWPWELSPGSRMPAYGYLFRPGRGPDGEALVAYLGSLGADSRLQWRDEANRWRPTPVATDSLRAPARDYTEYCAGCHGVSGHGDGSLARRLGTPPRDLVRAGWISFPAAARGETERLALARIIKFGLPGSAMAGHEWLADAEALALAAYVQALRGTP